MYDTLEGHLWTFQFQLRLRVVSIQGQVLFKGDSYSRANNFAVCKVHMRVLNHSLWRRWLTGINLHPQPYMDSTSADIHWPQQRDVLSVRVGVHGIGIDTNNENFIHCEFENMYCNVTGPWVKLASWNISEAGSSCPCGLQLFVNGTISSHGIQEGTSPTYQSLPPFSSPVSYTYKVWENEKMSERNYWLHLAVLKIKVLMIPMLM